MAVTMRQIAERLQVSQATVSRVLSGVKSPFISEATRERVMKAASEMGYKLNPLARSLATGKTQVVSVWVRNPDAPFYARVLREVAGETARRGYELILSGVQPQPRVAESASAVVRDLAVNRRATLSWPVDGVICVDMSAAAAQLLETQAREGGRRAPIVVVGSDPLDECDYVACDHAAGLGEATRRLIAAGRKRIAHVTSRLAVASVARERRLAVESACAGAGLPCEVIEAADESKPGGRAAVAERLARGGKGGGPDAIVALNDDLAVGAYRAVRDAGLMVPGDVALVGCDGVEMAEFCDVPISTVVQPLRAMAERAWELLERRIEDAGAEPQRVVLAARYEARGSTGGV
jgi:DNA-binding LacI/PurR family transcriptional regulator